MPFLNGGLFDLEDDYDKQEAVHVPNDAFERILDLFERYNFTVTESTPLDIEVAVDPEMLGKVFEELVTGRHESGSYYTPRPVVAFMCRESLKHYLAPVINDPAALSAFVDESEPANLRDPEAVLSALRSAKVCDPACGSGAYLLGMMHELLRLRQAPFATSGLDHATVYAQAGHHPEQPVRRGHRRLRRQHRQAAALAQPGGRLRGAEAAAVAQP